MPDDHRTNSHHIEYNDPIKPTPESRRNTTANSAPPLVNGECNTIPPADAHNDAEYMEKITIPLNNVPAFTPKRRLRVVTIGAGYAGMTLAQKIQHKYAEQMDMCVEHTIYESKDCVGGTWVSNSYPGVMCDVPSAIYVR